MKILSSLSMIGLLVLLSSWPTGPLEAASIQLRQLSFNPARESIRDLAPPDYYRGDRGSWQDRYALVQFDHPMSLGDQAGLGKFGLAVVRYVPDNAFIVRGSAGMIQRPAELGHVVYFDRLQPWFRIDPRVLPRAARMTADGDGGKLVVLRLCLFPGEDVDLVLALVNRMRPASVAGMTRPPTPDDGGMVLLAVPAAEMPRILPQVASLPGLEMALLHPRMKLLNNEGIWVHQSFVNGSTPLFNKGLTGYGQIVAVSDSGLDEDECYFYDTAASYSPLDNASPFTDIAADQSKRKVILYLDMGGDGRGDGDTMGPAHGTHTAGSITGDNYATPAGPGTAGHDNGDGMAPAAKLIEQDLGGSLEYLNNGGTFGEILEAAHFHGARIHSNSWGGSCCNTPFGCALFCIGFDPLNTCNVYDDFSRDADLKMWQHPDLLVLVAAGNDGSCGAQSIGTPATAKNILSVGATEHGSSAVNRGSFSGLGLCYDGRTKPTVMGQGVAVISAAGNGQLTPPSCATRSMDGTSMACPTTAGMSVLARQYYADGFYPGGVASTQDRFSPSGALVKATVINGSRDMTGVSGTPPNSSEGYGRVTLDDVLYFAGDAAKLLVIDSWAGIKETQPFSGSGIRDYAIQVNSSGQPLKVTLVWTDPPAALAASPARINDLNLSVQTGSGEQFFRDNQGTQRSDRSESDVARVSDSVNVEEQVLLASPAPGNYTVRIQAAQINQGPQHYAVVISGDVSWRGGVQLVPSLGHWVLLVLSAVMLAMLRSTLVARRSR